MIVQHEYLVARHVCVGFQNFYVSALYTMLLTPKNVRCCDEFTL